MTPPRKRPTKNRRFPYDPLALAFQVVGWTITLGPRIQAIVAGGSPAFPALIYAEVVDSLFGDVDGSESALWAFLMAAKPPDLTQAEHDATADLVECGGRISADMVPGIYQAVEDGKAAGKDAALIVKDVRFLINASIDTHDLEADVQAVIDAWLDA